MDSVIGVGIGMKENKTGAESQSHKAKQHQQDSENYHTASCFGFPSVLFVAYLISDIRNLR